MTTSILPGWPEFFYTLTRATVRQDKHVGLVVGLISARASVPCRNLRLARRVHRLERSPHLVHAVVKQIPNQQVSQRAAQVRILPHHVAEAEPGVVLADEAPHAIDALVEHRPPLAELR